ncbi:MAG: hypothetical protein J6T24_05245, partial [Clostridia bacterium]|nr:hypothetical protein [Clostridia bacterium]
MKRTLFLLLALLVLALALSACGETAGTTPAVTDPFTVGTNTTTAPPTVTTTVATTTAAPTPVSDNYIKEVTTMNTGAIRITLKDGSRLSLGSLPLREGYNSASIATKLDKYTGVLTLTITESTTMNIANRQLGTAKAPYVVALRENGGMLEFSCDGGVTWENLCDAKTGSINPDSTPLLDLAEILEIGKTEAVTGNSVAFAINNGSLRFRAREWKDGIDMVMDAKLGGSSNQKFNISYLAEIASSTALDSTSTSSNIGYTTFKGAGDDICPININGTYIGANHGYYIIAAIQNNGRMTEEDIGSIWESGGNQYVLVRVNAYTKEVKSNMMWFCPYDSTMMKTGSFSYRKLTAGSTLTHVSGATNTDDIAVTADSVQAQFYNAVNHYKEAAFLNGTVEVDLYTNGTYEAEFVDFYEEYDIIYLPTMLEYLIENVGYNTDASHCDDELTESYVKFQNTYRYHKNGACVVYSSYEFKKDVKVSYIGGVQSGAFSNSAYYVYVPGTTTLNVPTEQTDAQFNVGTNHLANPNTLVTSYFQFTDEIGSKGINLGFNPLYGTAVNDVRKEYILGSGDSNLAFYYTS